MTATGIDDRVLVDLLCSPMTETARAETLGITRPSYYRRLDRLARLGVIRNRGYLAPEMKLRGAHPRSRYSGTHHAPVQHISWEDQTGQWEVQGQLLDKWRGEDTHNTTIAIRHRGSGSNSKIITFAFEVRPVNRWSTINTMTYLPIRLPDYPPWDDLPYLAIENLTIAIARLVDNAEAIIVPEDGRVG